ncbi:MAG TPA: hypothetical protein PK280_14085 [Planctomycetota bacterium]|nr:hypothetical protein [Planctomycetota bacterium]
MARHQDIDGWHREPPAVADLAPGALQFPCWAEPKADGLRAVAVIDGQGHASIRSRTGLVLSCPRIAAELEELLRGRTDYVLDGEIAGSSFARTQSAISTGDDTGLRFNVWAFITASEWNGETWPAHQGLILDRAARILPHDGQRVSGHFRFGLLCHDEASAEAAFRVFRASGYEGAVYKPMAATWGERWLRRKEHATIDAPIVGLEEGHGRLAGTVGAVLVDVAGAVTRIGSGLSNDVRRALWELGDRARGRMVEFRVEAAPASGRAAPAVFVRMRPDKDG